MKKKLLIAAVISLFATTISQAQKNDLIISSNIKLAKDSVETSQLISNINDFLSEAYIAIEKNNWILQSEKLESSILLTELYHINKDRDNESPQGPPRGV